MGFNQDHSIIFERNRTVRIINFFPKCQISWIFGLLIKHFKMNRKSLRITDLVLKILSILLRHGIWMRLSIYTQLLETYYLFFCYPCVSYLFYHIIIREPLSSESMESKTQFAKSGLLCEWSKVICPYIVIACLIFKCGPVFKFTYIWRLFSVLTSQV